MKIPNFSIGTHPPQLNISRPVTSQLQDIMNKQKNKLWQSRMDERKLGEEIDLLGSLSHKY